MHKEDRMSFKIRTQTEEQVVETASEAVEKLDELRGDGFPKIEVIPETSNPEEVTASQREIEGRQADATTPAP
jgi:hypothetical protein